MRQRSLETADRCASPDRLPGDTPGATELVGHCTARDSLRFAFGADPAFVREGGSIGAVVTMQRHLGCPIMFIGLSLPEHGYHAPNENYDWRQARGGMLAFAEYLRRCGEIGKRRGGRRP